LEQAAGADSSAARGCADYLLVVVVALVLSGANVVGYTKCSKEASQQLRNLAAQAVSSGFTARALRCRAAWGMASALPPPAHYVLSSPRALHEALLRAPFSCIPLCLCAVIMCQLQRLALTRRGACAQAAMSRV
jgi:hypothetical protein